jgi:hypothetical protein
VSLLVTVVAAARAVVLMVVTLLAATAWTMVVPPAAVLVAAEVFAPRAMAMVTGMVAVMAMVMMGPAAAVFVPMTGPAKGMAALVFAPGAVAVVAAAVGGTGSMPGTPVLRMRGVRPLLVMFFELRLPFFVGRLEFIGADLPIVIGIDLLEHVFRRGQVTGGWLFFGRFGFFAARRVGSRRGRREAGH